MVKRESWVCTVCLGLRECSRETLGKGKNEGENVSFSEKVKNILIHPLTDFVPPQSDLNPLEKMEIKERVKRKEKKKEREKMIFGDLEQHTLTSRI